MVDADFKVAQLILACSGPYSNYSFDKNFENDQMWVRVDLFVCTYC